MEEPFAAASVKEEIDSNDINYTHEESEVIECESPLSQLPNEILTIIFEFLDGGTAVVCLFVCKVWKQLLDHQRKGSSSKTKGLIFLRVR